MNEELNPNLPTSNATALAKVDEVVEWYARQSLLRPFVAAYAGPIDAFLGTHAQKIAERRLQDTIAALREEFDRASSEKVDREYLESEEFYDLIIRILIESQRTRQDEKRRLLARVATAGATNIEFRSDAELCLEILSALSSEELALAVLLHTHPASTPRWQEWHVESYRANLISEGIQNWNLLRPELIARLYGAGIVEIHNEMHNEEGVEPITYLDRHLVPTTCPRVTDFFSRCLIHLGIPATDADIPIATNAP